MKAQQISLRFLTIPFFLFFVVFSMPSSTLAQSLSISSPTSALTIHPGDTSVPLTVSIGPSTYTGPISLTLTGLPSGITVSPLTLPAGGTGILQLTASVAAGQELFPGNVAGAPDTATVNVNLVAFAGSLQATTTLALTVSLENPSFTPPLSNINLPIVTINTNGVAVADKTTNVPGTITITSADGQTSYLPGAAGSDNTATFHLHGNTTASMPKKPYHVKLNTSTDLLGGMGLSCPYVTGSGNPVCDKSKSYVLLANYDDKTFLRDWSASALANAIPSGSPYLAYTSGSPSPTGTSTPGWWAPHSLFVELYLNGQYEGNYQLIEEVKVDSHRVNITEMPQTAISGAALTGGYLLEIDQRQGEDFNFVTPQGVDVGLEDPDYTPEVPEQTSYINSYVNTAENALFASTYTDPTLGWRAYFDEAAAVNFYIVNDTMGNVDGGDFYSSDYLYKDINNPLLYMGPIWDFDISAGNVYYTSILDPTTPWMQTQSPWYRRWFTDQGFKADVVSQWNALKNAGVFTSWLASIQQEASTLQQSQANNFGRWPMQGIRVWPNLDAVGSYNGEISYLTNWLNVRIGYLDAQFNGRATTSTTLASPTTILRGGSPTTLQAQVTGGTNPTGTVTFFANSAPLGTGQLNNAGVATLTTSNLPYLSISLQAVYNGDNINGLSVSSAVPAYVYEPLVATVTNLSYSATSIPYGSQANLVATVVANSSTIGTPTGSASFTSNGILLGSVPLSSTGTATLTTSMLPIGDDSIQASYSGNNTTQASSSNIAIFTVQTSTGVAPVFSHPAGTYTSSQVLTITDAMPGAMIYYTADGSTPTTSSALYAGPITITTTETIRAIAVVPGYANSAITSATYTIQVSPGVAAAPSFSLGSGIYTLPQTLTIADATSGAVIYYTTDGSTPTTSSTLYASPIAVTTTETIQAVATAAGYANSAVTSATYTIQPATPTFTLQSSAGSGAIQGLPATLILTVTPMNSFNQPVNLSCSSPPVGYVCTFSPATLGTASGVSSSTLVISSGQTSATNDRPNLPWKLWSSVVAAAFLFVPFRRRRTAPFPLLCLLLAVVFSMTGCGGSKAQTQTPPPSQTQQLSFTIAATGGGISQTLAVHVALTN